MFVNPFAMLLGLGGVVGANQCVRPCGYDGCYLGVAIG
jgi:hypothetical protein